jgi:hypothetical protein
MKGVGVCGGDGGVCGAEDTHEDGDGEEEERKSKVDRKENEVGEDEQRG